MNATTTVGVQTYTDHPQPTQLVLPPGSCDSHVHVFGPRQTFPYAEGLPSVPADAPKERLFALHQQMGIQRCVVVQSIMHGYDNRVVEDAIQAGGGRYLGVALVPLGVSTAELRRLAAVGFRAVRFHFMKHIDGGHTVDDVLALTPKLADVGMHLQVHFQSELIHTIGPQLHKSAVPVVIDHMARVDATQGPAHPDFQALKRALEQPHTWVKVSGIDRINSGARPGSAYPHGVALARDLVSAFTDKCVWGLDWPHPNHTHVPDDGELVNALAQIAPGPAALRALLVSNPERLYRF